MPRYTSIPNLDKNQLYQDYIINNMTARQIAEKYNTTEKIIICNLRRNSFTKDSEKRSELVRKRNTKIYIAKEDLYKLYIIENLSIEQITAHYHCSTATIGRLIKEYNLKKLKNPKKLNVLRNIIFKSILLIFHMMNYIIYMLYKINQKCI